MSLIILTGASGSGKTAIAEAIARDSAETLAVYHFDSIGVPSLEAMARDHGSPEAWQRDKTIEWLARLVPQAQKGRAVLFEGQMRPSFIVEAAVAASLDDYRIILIDCDDATRRHRLSVERGQPELADANMMNWAAYLRREAQAFGFEILDTSHLSLKQSVDGVLRHLID
ncbi:AAA family ATPase [Agrobacterium rhizogenes]|jgi:dephospho-CoA kinase|nr:AAA family ATPase [Rhizobium rhizogenes]NTJ83033.1 AAA family ATPase [Rhizobium rhizogenes]